MLCKASADKVAKSGRRLSVNYTTTSHLTRLLYAFDGILSPCIQQYRAYHCLHMGSVYVQKLVFPVLLLLIPSMESHKNNFDVIATTNKLPYDLSIII